MRISRPSFDSGSPLDNDSDGSPVFQGSFIETALLLGSGIGMAVEPKTLQFLPMPMSGVRLRDHKVLLAVLTHTVEAVGVAKEFVGIGMVKCSLGAVQSLLTIVKVRSGDRFPFSATFLLHSPLELGDNRKPARNRRSVYPMRSNFPHSETRDLREIGS